MIRHNTQILFTFFITLFLLQVDLPAQRTKSSLSAGEQRNAEKGLKDNRYYFYFINPTITNLGSEEDKKLFKEAIQRDIIAQQLYMKFMFHESWVEIRRAQKILIDLYKKTIARDLKISRDLLNSFAPSVVRSKDHRARHYLRLGYRDVTSAEIDMVMADNYRETLYSMRLYKYVRAIKKAKHGKRYAFLSIIEAKTRLENKMEFGRFSFEEINRTIQQRAALDTGNVPPEKQDSLLDKLYTLEELTERKKYEEQRREKERALKLQEEISQLKDEIKNLEESLEQEHPVFREKRKFYAVIHLDNYYRFREDKSFFDRIWEDAKLYEIEEYKEYLKMN